MLATLPSNSDFYWDKCKTDVNIIMPKICSFRDQASFLSQLALLVVGHKAFAIFSKKKYLYPTLFPSLLLFYEHTSTHRANITSSFLIHHSWKKQSVRIKFYNVVKSVMSLVGSTMSCSISIFPPPHTT